MRNPEADSRPYRSLLHTFRNKLCGMRSWSLQCLRCQHGYGSSSGARAASIAYNASSTAMSAPCQVAMSPCHARHAVPAQPRVSC
eukprot:1140865-Pelagomonas_calceolata.AAC.3